mgnify:FL=1
MRYVFASLGRFESLGIRVGGPGLANLLFIWANSIIYARDNNLPIINTTWKTIKIGTFLRRERDKRMYLDLFKDQNGIGGIKKFFLINFTNRVIVFSKMENLFLNFKHEHLYIKRELFKIINQKHLVNLNRFNNNSVGVHVRLGDFRTPKNDTFLRNGGWNYRIPIDWYVQIINKIKNISNIPVYIFTDGNQHEIKEILDIDGCKSISFDSSVSDMIALSRCKVLITSGSTFSMWASFLGQNNTIWFPGQLRQEIISSNNIFEGEIDYNQMLPDKLINLIKSV